MRRVSGLWTNFFNAALSVPYPSKCPLCDELSALAPCVRCREETSLSDPQFEVFDSGPLQLSATVFRYDQRAAQAVRRLKYERATALSRWMSESIAELAAKRRLQMDLIVPVPIHWTRRFDRGFNQSELLCEALPKPLVDFKAIVRTRATRPQVGLSREERLKNLSGAFRATRRVDGKGVLLVDDVCTTGQTARECAACLRAAGALTVTFIAFAGERR
jgi:ComF family protein